jgi:hypothetical protein
MKVGNIVTFSIRLATTLSVANVYGNFYMTLPIASNLTLDSDLSITLSGAGNNATAPVSGFGSGDTTGDRAMIVVLYNTTVQSGIYITGQYIIK